MASVIFLALSVLLLRVWLNAPGISCCTVDVFFLAPVTETSGWCRLMCVSMLDVLLATYPTSAEHRRQTILVRSTTLLPSLLYCTGNPKFSHTTDLYEAGGSSNSTCCISHHSFTRVLALRLFGYAYSSSSSAEMAITGSLWAHYRHLRLESELAFFLSFLTRVFVVWLCVPSRDPRTVTVRDEYKYRYTPTL